MEKPSYYATIPANVRYDSRLKDKAKLLYGEITALSNKNGYCSASNKYFADLYDVSTATISTLIKNLIDCNYIKSEIEYREGSKEILNRYLKILEYPIQKNLKDNNTRINNIKEDNNKLLSKKKFQKPTLDEVKEYCISRNNNINPEQFIDYYESNGWKVGRNSMKDWKATVRTWERNNKQATAKKEVNTYKSIYQIGQEALEEARREYENEQIRSE